jgi:transcriptional regulator with XRE-family HTH domain
MRKTQQEFSVMIGSQRNSVSRYESGTVEPSAPVLWRLYHLSERDEKDIFESALKLRLGADLTGHEVALDAPLKELGDFVEFGAKLDSIYSLNTGKRKDFRNFIGAVVELLMTSKTIDYSLIDILRLWRDHGGHGSNAVLRFREAAAYLRVGLMVEAKPNPEDPAPNGSAQHVNKEGDGTDN